MKFKEGNPYAPLRYAEGSAMARLACPHWRVVSIVLGATLGDGPPAWCESGHTGASTWRDGAPPAPAGVICDEDWRPVEVVTRTGRRLPVLVAHD